VLTSSSHIILAVPTGINHQWLSPGYKALFFFFFYTAAAHLLVSEQRQSRAEQACSMYLICDGHGHFCRGVNANHEKSNANMVSRSRTGSGSTIMQGSEMRFVVPCSMDVVRHTGIN
jgi:hypothetical protein